MKRKYVDQRTDFVESLYTNLKREAEKAKNERDLIASSVNEYLSSGLNEAECAELLIVEGMSRETAEGYIAIAQDERGCSGEQEYSFVFEDCYGNVYSSYDINRTIIASSTSDAWDKANEMIGDSSAYEIDNIISVDRAS
jgi:DNA-binding transcriptional regulator LsrR (DeoR family)